MDDARFYEERSIEIDDFVRNGPVKDVKLHKDTIQLGFIQL